MLTFVMGTPPRNPRSKSSSSSSKKASLSSSSTHNLESTLNHHHGEAVDNHAAGGDAAGGDAAGLLRDAGAGALPSPSLREGGGDVGGESVQLLCDLNSLAVRMKTLQGDINVWSPNKTPKLVTANNKATTSGGLENQHREARRQAAHELASAISALLGSRHALVQRLRKAANTQRVEELKEVVEAVREIVNNNDEDNEEEEEDSDNDGEYFVDAPNSPTPKAGDKDARDDLHRAAFELDASTVSRVALRIIAVARRAVPTSTMINAASPVKSTFGGSPKKGQTAPSRHPPHVAEALEVWDGGGRTALHCAVLRSDPERIAVAAALLDAGLRPSVRDCNGWTPLDIASLNCDRPMVEMLYSRWIGWMRYFFVRRQPSIRRALHHSVPDFACTISWRLDSRLFGALVRYVAPDDSYKIYKSGGSLRVDSTLAGYDESRAGVPRWRRGRLSLLLLPGKNGNYNGRSGKARLLLLNHDDRTAVDMTEPPRALMHELGSAANAMPTSPISPQDSQNGSINCNSNRSSLDSLASLNELTSSPTPSSTDHFHRDCLDEAESFGDRASSPQSSPRTSSSRLARSTNASVNADSWRPFSPDDTPAFSQEVRDLMCTDLEQSNVNIGEFDWSRATIRSGQPMHERVMGRDTVVFDASTRLRLRKTRMTREESGVLSWQNLGDQSSYDDYLQICQNERERRAECESAAYKAEADQRSKSWGEWLLGTTKHTKNAKQGHVLTGDADGAVNLGEFGKVTAKSRRLKGRVWLARGLPVHAHHLLPVLEACSSYHRHLSNLRRLVTAWCKRETDTDLFPVQLKVPLALSVYAYVGFEEVNAGPQDSRLFEPPSIVDDFDNVDADADSLARRSSSSGDRAHEHPILCGSLTYRRLSWSEAMVRMNLSADRRDDDEDALGGHSDIVDDDDDDDDDDV
ncbi:ankyrin repeat domain-containing protein 13 [Pycnococcus provasolii]